MAKRKASTTVDFVDTDPYRQSLARRRTLDRVLSEAQDVIGAEFTVMGRPAADIKLGHEAFDAIEKIRRQLTQGPRRL